MRISLFCYVLLLSSFVTGQTFVSSIEKTLVSSSQLDALCPNSESEIYWPDAVFSLVLNKKKNRYYINATVLKEKNCNSRKFAAIFDVILNQRNMNFFMKLEPLCDIMSFEGGLLKIQKSGVCLVRLNDKLYYFSIDKNMDVKQGKIDFDFRL